MQRGAEIMCFKQKTFSEFFNGLKKDAQEGVKENLDKMNGREKSILSIVQLYQQEKLYEQTKRLTWATWALATFTIILALVTYFRP